MTQAASPFQVSLAEQRKTALALRIGGASYRQIAAQMDLSVGRAHAIVQEALAETRVEATELTEQVRQLEIERLDAMLMSLWTAKNNPRVADTILRIQERRAKLLGLDVPIRTSIEGPDGGPIPVAVVDAREALAAKLDEISARLAAATPPSGPPLGDAPAADSLGPLTPATPAALDSPSGAPG